MKRSEYPNCQDSYVNDQLLKEFFSRFPEYLFERWLVAHRRFRRILNLPDAGSTQ